MKKQMYVTFSIQFLPFSGKIAKSGLIIPFLLLLLLK
jgi:hypothetical protein